MRLKKRPLVLVTGPVQDHGLTWFCTWLALWLCGATMRRATPESPQEDTRPDGIVITGGTDVLPESYGQARKKDYLYDAPRDAMESHWIARAYAEKIPLLGICRGAQLINVCRGGTLCMDIKLVCERARYPGGMWSKIFVRKPVLVKDGSLLAKLFRRQVLMVNSLHRQSLEQIGEGLEVTAWEENNIVQAVESTDAGHFVLGVQWHPEFMPQAWAQRRIFRRFVRHARMQRHANMNVPR